MIDRIRSKQLLGALQPALDLLPNPPQPLGAVVTEVSPQALKAAEPIGAKQLHDVARALANVQTLGQLRAAPVHDGGRIQDMWRPPGR